MKNIAIFASGNGSNFEGLVRADLKCVIKVLICNNKDAYAIKRAKNLNIACEIVCLEDFVSNFEYEKKIIELLKEYQIDLIVLAGYLKIFSKEFVELYERSIINLHPSKLPKYRGLNAIERAFNAGECEIGVSIHYVDSGVDTGEVIACETVKIEKGDSLSVVEDKVHKKEHELYPRVLEEIL
ncbi:MAG: phosphoribosylglycinamide formyltransferase [Bacilli bacterium]